MARVVEVPAAEVHGRGVLRAPRGPQRQADVGDSEHRLAYASEMTSCRCATSSGTVARAHLWLHT
jgi:hypothetical protein